VESGTSCADEWTVKSVGGTLSSCGGYRCIAGKCQQQCSGAADCAPDYECSGSQCKPLSDAGTATGGSSGTDAGADAGPTAEPSEDDGGCGCRTSPSPARAGAWWLLVTLAALRRRRSAAHA
jgi:MYXO-CTERM domain-containing protein